MSDQPDAGSVPGVPPAGSVVSAEAERQLAEALVGLSRVGWSRAEAAVNAAQQAVCTVVDEMREAGLSMAAVLILLKQRMEGYSAINASHREALILHCIKHFFKGNVVGKGDETARGGNTGTPGGEHATADGAADTHPQRPICD